MLTRQMIRIVFFILLVFPLLVFGQRPPDTTYATSNADGSYIRVSIWWTESVHTIGLKSIATYNKDSIQTLYSSYSTENDTSVCDTIFYFPNLKMRKHIIYKNGMINGYYREFYQNGNLKVSGSYILGIREGDWLFYDETETVLEHKRYLRGQVTEEKIYPIKKQR
jgi:antitoxin component YwqK of YwqJK toxin-antitoxin module